MKKIGFIGAGNMGGALVLAASKAKNEYEILVADKFPEKVAELVKATGGKAKESSAIEITEKCDLIFLGVKPNFIEATLNEILPTLQKRESRPTLVSMAAGVKIEKIASITSKICPVIRIMPNTPVSVGEGMILYDICPVVTEEIENLFLDVLSCAGRLDKLPEELIDAGCALSGCGPAFVFMFIDALAKGAENCGLDRERAISYAVQTLIGSAKLLDSSDKTPTELRDAVCSPGGSTIEGVRTLNERDFDSIIQSAIKASFEKTKQLGK